MKAVLRISLVVCVVLLCGMHEANAQWVQINFPKLIPVVTALGGSGSTLYAGTNIGVCTSTDNGLHWTDPTRDDQATWCLNGFAFLGSIVFANTSMSVMRSTDNGLHWTHADSGITGDRWCRVRAFGSTLFIGSTSGIFRSTDSGRTWTATNSGLPQNLSRINTLETNGSVLLAGTVYDGAYRSTDFGLNWFEANAGMTPCGITQFAMIGKIIVALTQDAIYKSTNDGKNWEEMNDYFYENIYCGAAVSGSTIFMLIASANYIGMSQDSGSNWVNINANIPENIPLDCMLLFGSTLFVGGGDLYQRPLSSLITNVDHQSAQCPAALSIPSNYPNPFSSSTTISFIIPSRSFVSLKIFDALGKEVSTLVSGDLEMGQHSYKWNAEGLRCGVYLCRLHAGNHVAMQKLSLLR